MDHIVPRDRDFEVDLESGVRNIVQDSNNDASSGVKTPSKSLLAKVCWAFADGKANGEEKRKKTSNKKPPRPPRGPSLDAADQKLIKEISELAMLKRARIERMKALKKVKATKASSNTNLFAMVFTILFCLVILFQGMSSRTASTNSLGSPLSSETADDSLISVQYFGNPSSSESNGPGFGSPNFIESVAGSDPPRNPRRAVRWAGKRRQLL